MAKNWLNSQIVKNQQPAGPISQTKKSKKQYGILTDGEEVLTDDGNKISLSSRINLDGSPVLGQDTIGIVRSPRREGAVYFELPADGKNQKLEYFSDESSHQLDINTPFAKNWLQNIRKYLVNPKFNTDLEDEQRWRSQYEADGGKVENGTKTPFALSGRSYLEGFKARNEALWDKVKNNAFVNMLFPVKEVSEGNTEAILPLIIPGGNAIAKTSSLVAGGWDRNAATNASKLIVGKWERIQPKFVQGIQKQAIKEAKKANLPITEDVMAQAAREQWVNPKGHKGPILRRRDRSFDGLLTDNLNADRSGRFYYNRIFKKQQGGKISDLLNNQEFLVNLEKCGGKMKKEACGGKMKKKK